MPKYTVNGADLQSVSCEMQPGERVFAETGHLIAMTDGLEMAPTTRGGFFSGLKRMVSGATFFVNEVQARMSGVAVFASHTPGRIQELDVTGSQGWLCQPNSFLCCDHGVDVAAAVTQTFGAGLFGGTGFILQSLTGAGKAFIQLGGASQKFTLAPGQSIRVETGSLAAFSAGMAYDIQMVGGIKSILFSGEGIWFAHLTGPGDVYIQSLTMAKLAHSLTPFLGVEGGRGANGPDVAAGALGGLLGAVLNGGRNDSDY